MKTIIHIYKILVVLVLSGLLTTACKENDYFLDINSEERIFVPNGGGEFDIEVDTNLGYYEFRFEDGAWLTGKVNGSVITLTAQANSQITGRTAVFSVLSLAYPELKQTIYIDQEGTYLNLAEEVPYLDAKGDTATITLDTNMGHGEWTVTVATGAEWMTAYPSTGSAKAITLEVDDNEEDYPRMGSLVISSSRFEALNISITVVQSGTDVTIESVIYTEDFSWLQAKAGQELALNIWSDGTQLDYKDWPDYHGWGANTNTVNGNGVWNYSRLGYVKMGRAALTSDLISPAMTAVEGTRDILVVFKAFTFMDQNGAADENVFKVSVIGDGEITEIRKKGGQVATPSGKQPSDGWLTDEGATFYIGNYNNPSSSSYPNWNGGDYDHLAPELADRSFVVSGATRNTQIRFLAGQTLGATSPANRMGFDNVLVALLK